MSTSIRAHAVSDVGLARSNNQDAGYSGRVIHAVADGMGGHAGGDVASALAIGRLAEIDHAFPTTVAAEQALREALREAQRSIVETVGEHPHLGGMGTTVSALAFVDDRVVVAHIGDSRIYRFREGALEQVTSDHTFVQRLVETGRITAEEAAHHPRRSVLMRVLGDIDQNPDADADVLDTRPGDRWLLCSDGLSSYVDDAAIRRVLATRRDARSAADAMLQLAVGAGAPDNVTIVVLDVVPGQAPAATPQTVGSAAAPLEVRAPRTRSHARITQVFRHPLRSTAIEASHFEPETDAYLAALIAEDRRRLVRRRVTAIVFALLGVAAVAAALWIAYLWTQTRFFVGVQDGQVAVFQGVPQDLGPITLHHLVDVIEDLPLDSLPAYQRQAVEATIGVGSLAEADATVRGLRDAAR